MQNRNNNTASQADDEIGPLIRTESESNDSAMCPHQTNHAQQHQRGQKQAMEESFNNQNQESRERVRSIDRNPSGSSSCKQHCQAARKTGKQGTKRAPKSSHTSLGPQILRDFLIPTMWHVTLRRSRKTKLQQPKHARTIVPHPHCNTTIA